MPAFVWGVTDWYGRLGYDSRRRAASRTLCWRCVCLAEGVPASFALRCCPQVLSSCVRGCRDLGVVSTRSEENETEIPSVCPHLAVESCGGRAVD